MKQLQLLDILCRFQIRTAVHEISRLTLGYKMMVVLFLGIISTTLNPVATVKAILTLAPAPQAVTIASIVTAYLFFSSMFNSAVVVSPQLSYLKQLPIAPQALLAAHVISLSVLNLFFLGAYLFALVIAYFLFRFPWYIFGALFFAGGLAMALGQVHYAWARTQALWQALVSAAGFFLFSGCLGYLFALMHHPGNHPLQPFFMAGCVLYVCVEFLFAWYSLCRYSHGGLRPMPLLRAGWILNIRGIIGLTVIDYIALWRMRKNEFLFRLLLCGLCLLYTIVSVMNNDGMSDRFYHVFVVIGAMVSFLLISTMVTANREYRKSAPWIQSILPLEHNEIWFADYFALFMICVPLVLIYMCAGTWLFQMKPSAMIIQSCGIVLIIALLSASASFFWFLGISDRKRFVFIQLSIGILATVTFARSLVMFVGLALLTQIPILFLGFRNSGLTRHIIEDRSVAYR